MKNVVSAGNALENILILAKVAPNDLDRGVILISLEELLILLAASEQENDIQLILLCVELLKALVTHITGSAGKEYGLFLCHNKFLQKIFCAKNLLYNGNIN